MKEGYVVPPREKLAFALGDFGNNLAMTAMSFYFLYYVVNVGGLSPFLAGLVYWIARSAEAVTDLLMGVASDRTSSRFGRRRVYLLAGALPMGVFFALLWLVPFKSGPLLFAYYLAAMLLFNLTLSVVTIPYNALMPELSQSYDERTSISGFRMAFSFLGNLAAAAGVALVVDNLFPGRPAYPRSYPIMGLGFGLVTATMVLVCFLGTKERVRAEAENPLAGGFFHAIRTMWQVRELRLMILLFILNQVGVDLFQGLIMFFLKDVMRLSEGLTSVVMATPLLIAIATVPLWVALGEKLGKRRAYIAAALFYLVPLLLVVFVPAGNTALVFVIAGLIGVGSSATQVLPWSMLSDVIEFDEYQNGVRREGLFMGVTQLVYKVTSALAVLLATSLIGAFGYVQDLSSGCQPGSAVVAIRVLLGAGTALLYLAAAFVARRSGLTKERFEEVKRLVAERKADAPAP